MRAARADARSLLARLRLPSGATRSAGEPAGDAGALAHAMGLYSTSSEVDEHAYWTVAASPESVLAFVRAHSPNALKPFTTGSSSLRGRLTSQDEGFQWPPITNVLEARDLFVQVAVLTDGRTGVRADADAVAITPRGTLERIPAGTVRLSLTVTGSPPGGRQRVLASVTSQAKIREVVALLNGLPLSEGVSMGCGPTLPPTIQLAFYSRRSGPLAVARFPAWPITSKAGLCSPVAMTINGRLQWPPLLALWYPSSALSRFPPLLTRLDIALNIKIPDSVPRLWATAVTS